MVDHGQQPWLTVVPFVKNVKFEPWLTMVANHGQPWPTMGNHGCQPWTTMVANHGLPWLLTMVNIGC